MAKEHDNWSLAAAMLLVYDGDDLTCEHLGLAIRGLGVTKLNPNNPGSVIHSSLRYPSFDDGMKMIEFEGRPAKPRLTDRNKAIRHPDIQKELRWLRERLLLNSEESNRSLARFVSTVSGFQKPDTEWSELIRKLVARIDNILAEARKPKS